MLVIRRMNVVIMLKAYHVNYNKRKSKDKKEIILGYETKTKYSKSGCCLNKG